MSVGDRFEHGMRGEERDKGLTVICHERRMATTLNAHASAAQGQMEAFVSPHEVHAGGDVEVQRWLRSLAGRIFIGARKAPHCTSLTRKADYF